MIVLASIKVKGSNSPEQSLLIVENNLMESGFKFLSNHEFEKEGIKVTVRIGENV